MPRPVIVSHQATGARGFNSSGDGLLYPYPQAVSVFKTKEEAQRAIDHTIAGTAQWHTYGIWRPTDFEIIPLDMPDHNRRASNNGKHRAPRTTRR